MRLDRAAIWAIAGTAVSVLAMRAVLGRAAAAAWRGASCLPDRCFCEQIRAAGIRQPANTWSSLAFVAVGFWILGSGGGSGGFARRPVHRMVFAAAVILIGYGSAFYHATLSFAGQFADVFGMYLLAVFVALHAWSRLRPLGDAALVSLYCGINAVLATLLIAAPALRRIVFAVVLLAGLALELRARRAAALDPRRLAAAAVILAMGFAVWVLDITRAVCAPSSVLQGHALWHLAGAAASLLLFRYYASEPEPRAAAPGEKSGFAASMV